MFGLVILTLVVLLILGTVRQRFQRKELQARVRELELHPEVHASGVDDARVARAHLARAARPEISDQPLTALEGVRNPPLQLP